MKSIQALLALFACAFLPLHAASLDDLNWRTTDGEVTITDCAIGSSGKLVIPDTIGGNPVTSIGGQAFVNCTSLTSITIPDSVTSIGGSAFYECTSLTSIRFPDSVTSIGGWAFQNCTSLTSITIGNGVTSIGYQAFTFCTSLKSITFEPNSQLTSIGEGAFWNCTSLTSITIPDGVTSIEAFAFDHCSSLTSITIPDSVTTIKMYAFYNCNSLTSITIPDSVTSIGGYAFYGCSSLTSITIPDGVTSIWYGVFEQCTSLTSITIPDGVTSIEDWAFQNCTSLTSITFLGTAPTTVGSAAFNGVTADALVTSENQASFGDIGTDWNGLTLRVVLVDTTPPDAPTLIGPSLTNSATVELTGIAEAGSTVKVYEDSTELGQATADSSNGSYTFTVTTLIEGSHSITTTATDAAGNASGPSVAHTVVVDTTLPVITVTPGADTVERGATWTDAGATAYTGETVTASGTVDTTTAGTYVITYSATDAAENVGTAERMVIVTPFGDIVIEVFKLTSAPFGFSFNTMVGRSYTVEATGDLRSWKAVELFQGSGGEIRFTAKPTSSGGAQFFRVFVK
jgi:hypothetical protein